jgi:UDP-4-amino-4,6-dideoxy-N-acetyl-beta-L-altrosamine transaminase
LPYGRQSVDEDDIAAVSAQLRDDWLTQGPAVARFEAALTEITGARYAVAVSSGTAALHVACLAAEIGEGDVGLVPDITFVATGNAVRYAGGRPVLVDVDPTTAHATPACFERALADCGGRAKALLPVSFAGSTPDLPAIHALAGRAGALVIEDAAHSLGATYAADGKTFRSGSCAHSDMAILSFHPVKHLTTAEGGAITTNDERLYTALCDLRTHGITKDAARLGRNDGPWYYEQQRLGFNYRITDVQCALGSSQAKKFPAFLARRRAIAAQYDAAFAKMAELVAPLAVPPGFVGAYHLYVVRVVPRRGEPLEGVMARRKALFLHLREHGIMPQVHYIPVHFQPDYVKHGFARGAFPGAEAYYAGCVSLPMFPAMTDADVQHVVTTVQHALGAGG